MAATQYTGFLVVLTTLPSTVAPAGAMSALCKEPLKIFSVGALFGSAALANSTEMALLPVLATLTLVLHSRVKTYLF